MNIQSLLSDIPSSLRAELIAAYTKVETNYREGRWEPSELNGGKLCEIVYTILKGYVDGNYPVKSSKPANMFDACNALSQAGSSVNRSVRIQIPRMLIALYEIRNNRGVGHVGGDVDPNMMDSVCVLQMCKWVVAELIRIFHSVTTEDAELAVEALSQRETSLVWAINGKRRVLDNSFSMKDKTLILLYSSVKGLSESELFDFLEHSNASIYRRDVLRKLHKDRFLEYNANSKLVCISPKGVNLVESL